MDLLQFLPYLQVFDRILVEYGGMTPLQVLTTGYGSFYSFVTLKFLYAAHKSQLETNTHTLVDKKL